jgi:imidazoleglycerol phosphate synthase glutamine amidotransferase subunit HisH
MQSLFEGSDESPSFEGLGIIPGRVTRFNSVGAHGETVRVPQMGWNGVSPVRESVVFEEVNPQDAVRDHNCLVAMLNFI